MSEAETLTETLKEQKEKRKKARREARQERDGALHHIRSIYEPKILELRKEWREATREIEKNYEDQLSEADKI